MLALSEVLLLHRFIGEADSVDVSRLVVGWLDSSAGSMPYKLSELGYLSSLTFYFPQLSREKLMVPTISLLGLN